MRAQPTPVTASRTLRNRQTLTARLIPVIGPDSELYGVHLWLSPTDTPPDAAPLSAFGFSWDNQLRRAVIPPALAAGTPRTTLTAPEILRFIEPDDVLSLFRALLSGEPGTRWRARSR
ncbi:hypothetical protein Ntsu_80480 [Nocardia sp. IFM 10818]